jgi:hypothetical protein
MFVEKEGDSLPQDFVPPNNLDSKLFQGPAKDRWISLEIAMAKGDRPTAGDIHHLLHS